MDVFFAKAVKAKSSFNPDEIVQVELVDFKSVLQKLLEGECFGAALAVAALLASAKRLLEKHEVCPFVSRAMLLAKGFKC
ncbi:MAG: hypothetical protein QMD13_02140 [Candidatus Bathyarchaeia archaeon]|nr:hypothetical protein [Candidatus Bathyarchaeia archaeon]